MRWQSKWQRTARWSMPLMAVVVVGGGLALAQAAGAPEDSPAFRNDVVTEVPIGAVKEGRYAFRASITTVAPGSKIPNHVHAFPGLRYMLDGSLTIAWKEGHTQTFSQGSTYYEGPGENHPPGVMAASNPGDVPARVLIVELVSLQP